MLKGSDKENHIVIMSYKYQLVVNICPVLLFVIPSPIFMNTFSLSLLAALWWSDRGASGATTVLTGSSVIRERRKSSVWVRL